MSWRVVVITGCAKLDYKMDYLVVRKQDITSRIHLSEIALVLIESTAISLTATLLSEFIKKKIKIIFCDEKHNPQSELLPYYGCHDTSFKIRQQVAWKEETKEDVWKEIVSEKIRNQMSFLNRIGFTEQADMLQQYILEIKRRDETNREGHAAKVYFNVLFGMGFTRTSKNLINIALDYGYSVILSCFNREIVANGYITQIGLFHDNMFNCFNLASDLMEPFRILIDQKVYKAEWKTFEQKEKMYLLNLLNEEIYIDGKYTTVINAIKIYCRSVFAALNNENVLEIKFYRYEL